MFQIIVDHKTIELSKTVLTFIYKSAIDIFNGVPGSYVFNAKLPATDNNNITFGLPARFSKMIYSEIEFPCRLALFHRTFSEGIITVRNANTAFIEITISLSAGRFNGKIIDLKLSDIMDETVVIGTTPQEVIDHCNLNVLKEYPSTDYNFPTVYNDWLYGEPGDEDKPVTNPDFEGFINQYKSDSFVGNIVSELSVDNPQSLTPFLYLAYVVKKCFTFFDYQISGQVFNLPEIRDILLYNNFTLDLVEDRYSYSGQADSYAYLGNSGSTKMILNENIIETDDSYNSTTDLYEIKAIGFHEIAISFEVLAASAPSGELWVTVQFMVGGVNVYDKLTKFTITDEYQLFEGKFTLWLFDTDIGDTIHAEINAESDGVFPDFNTINGTLGVKNISQCNLNRFRKSISYKDHVPDILISEFLQSFYKSTATFPVFDHSLKSCEIAFIKDVLPTFPAIPFSDNVIKNSIKTLDSVWEGIEFSYDFGENDELLNDQLDGIEELFSTVDHFKDLHNYPPLNSVSYVKSLNKYFKYVTEKDEDENPYTYWEFFSDNFKEFVFDDGGTPIVSMLSPMGMIYDPSDIFRVNMPAIRQVGSSFAYNKGLHEFSPRIVIWRGLGLHALTGNFPLATSYDMDTYGTQVYDYDLRWNAENGLVNKFWLPVIEWYMNRIPVEFRKLLDENDLLHLVFNHNYFLDINNLILSELNFKVDSDKLYIATIKGWITR